MLDMLEGWKPRKWTTQPCANFSVTLVRDEASGAIVFEMYDEICSWKSRAPMTSGFIGATTNPETVLFAQNYRVWVPVPANDYPHTGENIWASFREYLRPGEFARMYLEERKSWVGQQFKQASSSTPKLAVASGGDLLKSLGLIK